MIIIDNIADKSPILEWKPKPAHFKSTYEKEKYWAKRKQEDIEGVGDIPGTLVHKTQEQWIKDRDSGVVFRPVCRDVDLLVHQTIARCRKEGKGLLVIKGRGVGLSTEFGCLSNYFMKMHPGTNILLTSQEKAKIASLFSDKVAFTYDRYDEDIRPVEVNRNETISVCNLKTEQIYLDHNGVEQINTSQIICRETSDTISSASAFSGLGAILGNYDEIFLHKRRKELVRSSTSCFMNAKTRVMTGFLFAGGTCEDTLKNTELAELRTMIEEVQKHGRLETMPMELLFIPSWMGTFMTNGWSDEKKGREWWEKEIEALDKLDDKAALRAFRMNNPMSLQDIFELEGGNRFDDDVMEMVKARLKKIKDNPKAIWKGTMISPGGVPATIESKAANVHILEEPQQGANYYVLVDAIGSGSEAGGAIGSNMAITVFKGMHVNGTPYCPVAYYSDRPKRSEDGYRMIVNFVRHYNKYGGMKGVDAEANVGQGEAIASYLKHEGLGKFIINRKDLSGKKNADTTKYFQHITIDIREYQYEFFNIFLRKYIEHIDIPVYLEQMLELPTVNTDELDSLLLAAVVLPKDFDKPVAAKIIKPRQSYVRTMENGMLVWKLIDNPHNYESKNKPTNGHAPANK